MAGTRGPGAIRPPRRPDSPYPPAPRLVPCLAPGGSRARSPPRCSSQAVGELDLPASRGCCAAAATLAAAALRRSGGLRGGGASRAPGRVRGGGRGGRLPYLPRPVPDPWGRVTAGALPYLPGAAQTLSGSGERRDLITYLSEVAWFPPPPPHPRRCGSGVGCTNSQREPGLAAEWGGLLQQSGRPTYFRGGGVATQSLPYFSRISLWPEELARLCAGVRVGGVSSSDSRRDLIRRAVLEAGRLFWGEGEGAPGGFAESYRICLEQRRLEERATAGGRRTWGAAWAVSAGWDGGTCRQRDWGPWPETLSAGGALGQGCSWGSGEAAQRQGQAEIGPRGQR